MNDFETIEKAIKQQDKVSKSKLSNPNIPTKAEAKWKKIDEAAARDKERGTRRYRDVYNGNIYNRSINEHGDIEFTGDNNGLHEVISGSLGTHGTKNDKYHFQPYSEREEAMNAMGLGLNDKELKLRNKKVEDYMEKVDPEGSKLDWYELEDSVKKQFPELDDDWVEYFMSRHLNK